MKIYLAARYSRREELCRYREELVQMGHHVTSRWLNGKHQINDAGVPIGDDGEQLVETDGSTEIKAVHMRSRFAHEDVDDVLDADLVISFTEQPRSTGNRGGRHVEFGIALAMTMRLIVVGHRENIFHWLPEVEFCQTWDEAKALVGKEVPA